MHETLRRERIVAGVFILNQSKVQFSSASSMKNLFAKIPSRYVILLEHINAVNSNQSRDAEIDRRQITTGCPSRRSEFASRKVSLSALLNIINGIGSQEGRILILTTNYIIRLNKALIRPGRVDIKVEFGLADKQIIADLFSIVFKPVEGDITPERNP